MEGDDHNEVNPDDLQRQLTEIQSAIGIEEQYPGQRRLWLRYGALVGSVSVVAQLLFVFVTEGPGWFYLGVWIAYVSITGLSLMRLATGMPPDEENVATPNWRVLFGTLVVTAIMLGLQSGPLLAAASESLARSDFAPLNGAWAYSLVISVAGIGFLFAGNGLRAYHIRSRDRWVFYAAGLWMLVYATAFTNVVPLRRVGYGAFGVLFGLYAVGAYLSLGRGSDET